jgi:hypothetical protein
VRIDRLSLRAGGLIFSFVKRGNAESERTDTVSQFTHPTQAQLYALEQRARRERSQAQARLILAGVSAVKSLLKSLFVRALSLRAPSATHIQGQVARHA